MTTEPDVPDAPSTPGEITPRTSTSTASSEFLSESRTAHARVPGSLIHALTSKAPSGRSTSSPVSFTNLPERELSATKCGVPASGEVYLSVLTRLRDGPADACLSRAVGRHLFPARDISFHRQQLREQRFRATADAEVNDRSKTRENCSCPTLLPVPRYMTSLSNCGNLPTRCRLGMKTG